MVNDPEGTAFNAAGHVMGLPGYPHWEDLSPNSNVWERGPLACATDPCNQWLQADSFFSSIVHSTQEVIRQLRARQDRGILVISPLEVPLIELVEWVYEEEGALLYVLTPSSHSVGLDLDDPDWITLPSVTPPLSLEVGTRGSQWLLLGANVKASVIQEEEQLAYYKKEHPGFSAHLLSVNTVIQWAAPDTRGSLRQEKACFNLFQPLARVLTQLPLTADDLYTLVKSEVATSVNKLRRCITSLDTVGAADEDIVQEYQVRSCDIGVRVYTLFLILKIVLLSDYSVRSVRRIGEVHSHSTPHSSRACWGSRCASDADTTALLGRRRALDWINSNIHALLHHSNVLKRLGSAKSGFVSQSACNTQSECTLVCSILVSAAQSII